MLGGIDGISITDGEVWKINAIKLKKITLVALYVNFLLFYPTSLNCSRAFTLSVRNPLRVADTTFVMTHITPPQRKAGCPSSQLLTICLDYL